MSTPERWADVVKFWFEEVGPSGWWTASDHVDSEIARRFADLPDKARAGQLADWRSGPQSWLALIIVLDQFPRNLHRGAAKAFAYDPAARAEANAAITAGADLQTSAEARGFFYLPFEHSEDLADQERSVALFSERLPEDKSLLHHAIEHRNVIAQFGRFPHRNAACGRVSTPEEAAFLRDGGYQPGQGGDSEKD